MTEERMALIELVENQADGDLLREMLAFAAERIMEAEVEARTGAAKGARSPMTTRAFALRHVGLQRDPQRCRIHWMRNALAHAPASSAPPWRRC